MTDQELAHRCSNTSRYFESCLQSLRLAICLVIVPRNHACFPIHRLAPLHDGTLAASVRFIGILSLLNLPNELLKGLGDVLVIASTRFGPGTLQLLRKFLPIFGSDLTLLGAEIALVTDNDNREPLNTLGSRPLVSMRNEHGGPAGHWALGTGQLR